MTDKLTEALAHADEMKALYPGQVNLGSHQHVLHEAARRWASFPTDDDVEAATEGIGETLTLAALPSRALIKEAARAALEAVKREEP
jgi:hypothetical protein